MGYENEHQSTNQVHIKTELSFHNNDGFLLFHFIGCFFLTLSATLLSGGRLCWWVRSHLSPAEATVTCSAGSNLCCGHGDTVVHAEAASFLSAKPSVLDSHFLSLLTAPPQA